MTKHKLTLLGVLICLIFGTSAQAQSFWGSSNERYKHKDTHTTAEQTNSLGLKGWRGETLNAQAVVQNLQLDEALYSLRLTRLVNKHKKALSIKNLELGYVDEVLADTFSGCSVHDVEQYGRFRQADRIVTKPYFLLPPGEQRGIWLSLELGRQATPDTYHGALEVLRSGKVLYKLPISIEVLAHQLPEVKDWRFHLDFWQNPYAIARWHEVELWSPEHFEAMTPYMQRLAATGQKVITATLIDRPWDGQTQDPFSSMVGWTKHRDGRWSYDYKLFDQWVDYMLGIGIDKEITCFSMIPWKLAFAYYDEESQSQKTWEAQPGDSLYRERWGHFLANFAKHLREKGWFEKTTIAMDERKMAHMQEAINIIHSYAPGLKISMAGDFHPEIEDTLHDYCIDLVHMARYTPQVIAKRKKAGKVSTFYTCCSSPILNTFTFSPPAEAELIPWYALSQNLDGYLRWAYNSWTIDPNYDSRFRSWSSGDTYIVYPNNYPSIRWQKLLEGIQQFEKYHILKQKAEVAGDKTQLQALEELLHLFDIERIAEASTMATQLKERLNQF